MGLGPCLGKCFVSRLGGSLGAGILDCSGFISKLVLLSVGTGFICLGMPARLGVWCLSLLRRFALVRSCIIRTFLILAFISISR
jgi:hypothetical protein